MKKSEFVKRAVRSMQDSDCAYNLVELAEAAGVKWDPEEPKLPKRVRVVGTGTLVTADSNAARDQVPMGLLAREAAACYNLVRRTRIHDAPDRELYHWELLRTWLQKEREKLQ